MLSIWIPPAFAAKVNSSGLAKYTGMKPARNPETRQIRQEMIEKKPSEGSSITALLYTPTSRAPLALASALLRPH